MLNDVEPLPENPTELRQAAVNLMALAKSQALRIEKLEHELNGHRRHRFGAKGESADQLRLDLETLNLEDGEIGAARDEKARPAASEDQ